MYRLYTYMNNGTILKTSYGVNLTVISRKKRGKVVAYLLEMPDIMVEDTSLIKCNQRIVIFLEVVLDKYLADTKKLFNLPE
jgi:hypothetical protein